MHPMLVQYHEVTSKQRTTFSQNRRDRKKGEVEKGEREREKEEEKRKKKKRIGINLVIDRRVLRGRSLLGKGDVAPSRGICPRKTWNSCSRRRRSGQIAEEGNGRARGGNEESKREENARERESWIEVKGRGRGASSGDGLRVRSE